jgi:DNA-binding response OmpR family regulator
MTGPKTIMIADDDAGIVDAVAIMLQLAGYETRSTFKGSTLLSLSAPLPDLIILDIWMSGEDGTEICKQLKNDEATKDIPILMFSASKEIEKSARAAGANDFIAKPFDMNDLLSKIAALL